MLTIQIKEIISPMIKPWNKKDWVYHTLISASNSTFPSFTVKLRNSTLGLGKIFLSEPALTVLSSSCCLVQVETGDVGDVYKIRVSCDDVPGFKGWHLKSLHLQELHTKQELNFECNCWLTLKKGDKELVKEFPTVTEDQKTLPGKGTRKI